MGADPDPGGHGGARTEADPVAPLAEPVWFGPEDRPRFGWVHSPGARLARGAVVLCPPLARERTTAHSTFRLLAEELARGGLVAVRFDYDGTGDSAGDESEPARVQAWLDSLVDAVALARSVSACPVALVGMRMGALLAATALSRVADDSPVEALVLWDPCPSGRRFVREQRALQAVRLTSPRTDGAEVPGYELTAETVAALSRLEMPDLASLEAPVLLLERADRPSTRARVDALPGNVERVDATGQDRLLDVLALTQEIPFAVIERVSGWLARRMTSPATAVVLPARRTASLTFRGTEVTERLVGLGPHRLFGVEATAELVEGLPPIIMLNSGNEWHAGPNRLWVELSRRWASRGFRCIRFDESGLGDSPPRPGREPHVVRAPDAFDDVAEAAAAVSPHDPDDVVLVGLCSGAYQALEHALAASPRGVYAVNPILHFRPPELARGGLDPRRRLCRPTTAAVRAYRRMPVGGLRRVLRRHLWRAVQQVDRLGADGPWPEAVARRGVRVLLVGGEDELRPVLELVGAGDRRTHRVGETFEIEVVPGLDHDLVVADDRRQVCDRLTEHLLAHWPPAAGAARRDVAAGTGGAAVPVTRRATGGTAARQGRTQLHPI
jgi:alpha-beta hydrolase superfamily lysophospholipase